MPTLTVDPHPLLALRAFSCELPLPIAEMPTPDWLAALLNLSAAAPFKPEEEVRAAARDLLRHGGFKPTGRSKPASEYLVRAAGEGALKPINAAVDACNAASLHSGLPMSVVDLDRAKEPFRVGIAPAASSYVFNASGQVIDLSGLLCLYDAEGPCANAVKDAQRTKTQDASRRTLSVVWGAKAVEARADAAVRWYRELLEKLGAKTDAVG